jgi:ferrous iron transport protein A
VPTSEGGAAAEGSDRSEPPMDRAQPQSLVEVEAGTPFFVHEVVRQATSLDWHRRLEELGFLPGELVMVMARGQPGGDPLAVRVGQSMFALRRAEAACVIVRRIATVAP